MAATSPPLARGGQSKKTISYQFRCEVVVYIMAGPNVVRLRRCSWLTNNLGGPSLLSDKRAGVAGEAHTV